MADSNIGEDLRLLKKKLSSDLPAAPKRSAAAARRERDSRHMLKENDGRRRRPGASVERPEQINFKCVEGTKGRFRAVADALNVSMIAVLERALELVEAEAGIEVKS